MNVAVLVPFRSRGCEYRETNFRHVRRLWADAGYFVLPCDDGADPFSRAASINRGYQALDIGATVWADVVIIADADTVVPEAQASKAVEMAAEQPGLVVAFNRYRYLTEEGTERCLARKDGWRKLTKFTLPLTVSSCVAVSTETWDTVGGFDPRFRAWGFEDVAFEAACNALAGPTRWVHGDCHHLYHPTEPQRPSVNEAMADEYLAARENADAMRELLDRVRCSV